MEYHFAEREKAKKADDLINDLAHKTIMNSGYGKFALNPRDFCDYALAPVGDASLKKTGYQFSDDVSDSLALWEKSSYTGDGFYDVATAASITGYVRAMLWTRIVRSRKRAAIYYCDTDGLAMSNVSTVRVSKKLGGWKYEGYGDRGAFAGKKLYALRGDFGKKGKEKKASKGANLTFAEIMRIGRGKSVEWANKAPSYRLGSAVTFVKRTIVSTNCKTKRGKSKKNLMPK